MPGHKDPAGLAFLEKLAERLCDEYNYEREWSRFNDSYFLTVCSVSRTSIFSFERRLLDDPGSDHYREAAEGVLARMLREFQPTPGRARVVDASTGTGG